MHVISWYYLPDHDGREKPCLGLIKIRSDRTRDLISSGKNNLTARINQPTFRPVLIR